MHHEPTASDIRAFWFEESMPMQWFRKDPAFDGVIRARFGGMVEEALAGRYDGWAASDLDGLALILLLDQFTRNLYRGDPRSFAGDAQALAVSERIQARGSWTTLQPHYKHFILVPMMHSEDLLVQERSLPLFAAHCDAQVHTFGVKHRDIIARFGRFPHRNAVLGRTCTPEETAFLQTPGSSF